MKNEDGQIPGWNSNDPIFEALIRETDPKFIIEVGSWLGASAVHMLGLCDAHLYCVDTWLGSLEHWRAGEVPLDENGWPNLYGPFIQNITEHGFQERVTTMPMPSRQAAVLLRDRKVLADLIYLDASHNRADLAEDLLFYFNLLRPGGVIFGDDYRHWLSVKSAVDAFADHMELPVTVNGNEGNFWILRP